MRTIGIDASNLYSGGSKTHLSNFLHEFTQSGPEDVRIIIFLFDNLLIPRLTDSRLKYVIITGNANSGWYRFLWQNLYSLKWYRQYKIDILFVPGGTYLGSFRPFVVMCRNMLLFERSQRELYGHNWFSLKFLLLKWMQLFSFKRSSHTIYISEYAQNYLRSNFKLLRKNHFSIIPHGVTASFKDAWIQKSTSDEITLCYISAFEPYKRHLELLQVVSGLNSHRNIRVILVGSASNPEYHNKVVNLVEKTKSLNTHVEIIENATHPELIRILNRSNIFVFPSTCENMPNALLEAQVSGIPVLISSVGASREFQFEKTLLFDPTDKIEFENAITGMIDNYKDFCGRDTATILNKYNWSLTTHLTLKVLLNTK